MIRHLALLILLAATGVHAAQVDCFATRPDAAALVVEDALVLRESPDMAASAVHSTAFADELCVLLTQSVQGRPWALVRTVAMARAKGRRASQGQGWIPASGLARWRELVPLRNTRPQQVPVDIGDSSLHYAVDAHGQFAVRAVVGQHECRPGDHPDEYGACNEWGLVRGRLRAARSLVVADRTADVFRLMPDGLLCPERGAAPPAGCPRPGSRATQGGSRP